MIIDPKCLSGDPDRARGWPLAARMAHIEPFHVMRIMARADALAAEGRPVTNMVIGEPDMSSAEPIIQGGIAALQAGRTRYAPDLGLPRLREAIARSYDPAARVDPERVLITPGSSGALQVILAALISPGDEVLMTDPGYPCSRHFVRMFEGVPVGVPVGPETDFQLTAELVRARWTARTVAVLVASPSNPVGSVIPHREMVEIARAVEELGGVLIVDEIYQELVYDGAVTSAAGISDRVFIVNSFSKYQGMTGWRVGWMVQPAEYVAASERLIQNIFIAASTPAQHAALEAFTPAAGAEFERRRQGFRERRDYLLAALTELGFSVPSVPRGAFYVYADCSRLAADSAVLAEALLEEAGVAIAPGLDFGRHLCERYVRLSYASSLANLREGVQRMRAFLTPRRRPSDGGARGRARPVRPARSTLSDPSLSDPD